MDLDVEFPPHTLREYALLADGERGVLIGPRGDMAWMCAPSWESEAVFSTLIGGAGCYAVTPRDRFTWGGYYDERSLIWNSRWVTSSGAIECREALARPADAHTAVVLRRVQALDRPARLRVLLDVRSGFGSHSMHDVRHEAVGIWAGRSGPIRFRWSGARGARSSRSGPMVLDLTLEAGETRDLVLEVSDEILGPVVPDPDACWLATEAAWDEAVPELEGPLLARRDSHASLAVLSGLTSSRGGMVAAATMSLPERAEQGRNYDYRYAWIRDQCYAGRAVALHGQLPLLDSSVRFVSERLMADGPQLKPAYTVSGGPVPDERSMPQLTGYPGGSDKSGNWVNKQFQLDAFGESLELLAVASAQGRLDIRGWEAVEAAVASIERRWDEPDAGIWELDNQRWTHSRLTCVSGLRAAAAEAPAHQSGRWSALADTILADVSSNCLHPDGRWQRSPGDARVDAALLLPVIRGVLPVDDPRNVSTIETIERELVREDYVYRFRPDARPLGEAEGSFLLCGFLMALTKHRQGDRVTARALFERNRSASGTSGLLAEEFDIEQRQLRGNLPQAFVHALLLECGGVLAGDADPRTVSLG